MAGVQQQKRVLIIDDDIDLLMLLERKLQQEEYEVETAASLPEAEELVALFQPHLVLLDININGEDGRLLCGKLKTIEKGLEIKVIIMSGYDYSSSRAHLFGADEMVAKPFNVEYLIHRIATHLDDDDGVSSTTSQLENLL
ncbi:MAG: response regulator [Bacteroidota bacterium]|jgi:DNA-binding response OmpR family regulator|nr:response regulator [Bacteroidota bacterium]